MNRGCFSSSFTASTRGRRRPGGAGRPPGRSTPVASTRPSGTGDLAGARQRGSGIADHLGRRAAELAGQRLQRRRRQRAGIVARGQHQRVALRDQRGQHGGGVLVVEDRDDRDHRLGVRPRTGRRAPRPARPCPRGCARRRAPSAAPESTTSRRPGNERLGRRRGHRGGVELAEIRLGRGPGQREVPPLVGPERAQRHARVGARA